MSDSHAWLILRRGFPRCKFSFFYASGSFLCVEKMELFVTFEPEAQNTDILGFHGY